MPASIGPELAADGGVADHEANRIGDFFGADQPSQLSVGKNLLFNIPLGHPLQQRRIHKSRMDNPGAHTVEHCFLHQC